MNRVRNVVGWMVRGGDQTRAELSGQSDAIRELQRQVADMRAIVEAQAADGERVRAEVRDTLGDLSERLVSIVERLDQLEARVADHHAEVASLTRVVAAPGDD